MRVAALVLVVLLAPVGTAAAQAPLEDLGPARGALLSDGRHVVFHVADGTSTQGGTFAVLDTRTGARRTVQEPRLCPPADVHAGVVLLSCENLGRRFPGAFALDLRTMRRTRLPGVRVRGATSTRYAELGRRWAAVAFGRSRRAGVGAAFVRLGSRTPLGRTGARYREDIDLDRRDPRPALCSPLRRPRRPVITPEGRVTRRVEPGGLAMGRGFGAWTDGDHVFVQRCGQARPRRIERCAFTCDGVTARSDVVAFVEDTTATPPRDVVHAVNVRSGRRVRWSVERTVAEDPVLAGARAFLIANTPANTFQLLAGPLPR